MMMGNLGRATIIHPRIDMNARRREAEERELQAAAVRREETGLTSLLNRAPQQNVPTYDPTPVNTLISNFFDNVNRIQPTQVDWSTPTAFWGSVAADRVDPTREANRSLNFNLDNMGQFTSMARDLTSADTSARISQLDTINPNWRAERDKASEVNMSWLSGEVSKDVSDALARTAAFTTMMGGSYGGGQNARAATARDLGITSLELQQQGQESARSWQTLMGSLLPEVTRAAGVMESQGLSPQQTINTALENSRSKLLADTSNAQGRLSATQANQSARLQAATGRSQQDLGWAQLKTGALQAATDMGASNILNAYNSQVNQSNVQFANQNRPWQFEAEWLGQRMGANQSYGFGVN